MAGGISKTIGALLVLVSVLLLLAGIGAAGFGFYNENDQKDNLFYEGSEEQGINQMLMVGGGIGAGAGLIGLVVGLLFRSFGKGRAQSAFQREILDVQRQALAAQTTTSAAPPTPAFAPAPAPVAAPNQLDDAQGENTIEVASKGTKPKSGGRPKSTKRTRSST